MVKRLSWVIAVALSITVACNADRATGSDGILSIEVAISDAIIGPAESATMTYTLRNKALRPLQVAAGCGSSTLYVDDEQGTNVHPGNRSILCTAIGVAPDFLRSGDEVKRTFTVSGSAGQSGIKLPAGRYTAEAEFLVGLPRGGRYDQLRSREVSFEVTP